MEKYITINEKTRVVEVPKDFFGKAKVLGSPEFKELLMILREYPDCKFKVRKD